MSGTHAIRFGGERDECCAPDCEAASAIPSRELPLCERHVITAYRLMLEFGRSFERNPAETGLPVPGVLGVPLVERDSHVYYILFGDRIKIGVTTNLLGRLDGLPWDRVLTVEQGTRELEQKRHRQFAAYRVNGEWFQRGEELLRHIDELVSRERELGPGMRRFLRMSRAA